MRRPSRLRRLMRWTALILAIVAPALRSSRADQESWDAIYIGESKVGHMHLWIKPVKDTKGRELTNVRVDWELNVKRGRDTTKVKQFYGTIETPEGEVLRLDTITQAGGQNMRTSGDVVDGKMNLTLEVGGRRQQVVVPWDADVRGPYGAEMSLSRQPLEPGLSRTVKTYIPDLNKVCLTKLDAVSFEDVPLGPSAEKRRLLKVESVVTDADGKAIPGLATTLWVDGSGQIMKSKTDLYGGMFTFRTTKDGALAESRGLADLLKASIKPTRQIPNSERTRSIVYRIKGTDAATIFPGDHRQTVREETKGAAIVEVKTDGPTTGEALKETPGDEYLRPNPLINSEDPQVVKLSKQAVGTKTDPWERSEAIQDWVFQNMKSKNFAIAFAPAAEVARDLAGDCTEHSVLTTALCRAAGIPARCAIGLVYAQPLGGFGPHMWTEVFVNGRWVALDATFNQSQVDATHIKLTDSSLDGVAPFEAFLPVLKVLSTMQIEPLEIR